VQKLRRDDNVVVKKGKDRGQTGQVRKVLLAGKKTDKFGKLKCTRVIVTGVNMVKKHQRPRGPQSPGGIIERESPIAGANVAILCVSCSKPARVGFRLLADDRKVRYCKRCDANLD
jgi:large subunit ribosomal protein L24